MCTTYRVLQGFPAFLEFLFLGVYLFMCVNLFIAEYSLLQILLIAETLSRLSFFFSLFLHVFVCIAIYFFLYCQRVKIPFWSLYIAPLIATTFLFLLLYTFVPFISEIPFLSNPCIVLLITTNFFFHILISFFSPCAFPLYKSRFPLSLGIIPAIFPVTELFSPNVKVFPTSNFITVECTPGSP